MIRLNTHVLAAIAVAVAAGLAFFGRSTPAATPSSDAPAAPAPELSGAQHAALQAAQQPDLNPHTASGPRAEAVTVGKVERAAGALGHTIAELFEQRSSLVGKTVRVRGVVVKSIEGILDRSFVHLRDGSGDAATKTHELVVTTEATPRVGELLLVEGTLGADKDFGFGYRYPVIIENARVVSE